MVGMQTGVLAAGAQQQIATRILLDRRDLEEFDADIGVGPPARRVVPPAVALQSVAQSAFRAVGTSSAGR